MNQNGLERCWWRRRGAAGGGGGAAAGGGGGELLVLVEEEELLVMQSDHAEGGRGGRESDPEVGSHRSEERESGAGEAEQ